jgi:putative inorganic carbon (hco3(-)) transporter
MWLALIPWVLVSLLSILLVGNYPLWALGFGALGGTGIGVWNFYRSFVLKHSTPEICQSFVLYPRLHAVLKYDLFLQIPLLFVLLLSNRLPLIISFVSLVIFVCFGIYRKRVGTLGLNPLILPILLLFLLSITTGLYASPDAHLSIVDVFQLAAGIGFFYVLVEWIDSGSKLKMAVIGFMGLGALLGGISLFIVQAPPIKLPILGRIFMLLPNILPRFVNPNYIAGLLVLFLFLPFWSMVYRRGQRAVMGFFFIAIATGLLLTQSRSALIGVGIVLILTVAWRLKWARYIVGVVFVLGGIVWLFRGDIGGFGIDLGSIQHIKGGRKELWQRALYIIQDFSFTGIGLHSFSVVVDLLYPLFLVGPDARMPHAHNLFLQVAVDVGIPGFVAFWMLLGAWGAIVWELLKKTGPNSNMAAFYPIVLGCAGGLVGHLIYGLTDAIALGEKAGLAFWVNLALTVSLWRLVQAQEDSRNL